MSEEKSFTQTYTRRRTITAGEPTEVVIKKVGYVSNVRVGMIIEAAGEYYLVTHSLNDSIDSDYAVSQLTEFDTESNDVIKLEMYFDEKMENCGFTEEDYNLGLEHLGDSYSINEVFDEDKSDDDAIESMLLWTEYNSCKPKEENGWRHEVSSVTGVDEESFTVEVLTDNFASLEWNLDIPLTTEDSESQVAKLIEEQGGGRPDFIEDKGEVNVMRESDVPSRLDVIGYDKTGDWALINPSVFDQWLKKKKERKKNRSSSSSSSRSRSRTQKSRSEYKKHVMQGLFHGLIVPMIIKGFLEPFMLNSIIESSSESTPAMTETLISMIDMMVLLMVIMGVLSIMYGMIGMMTRKE